MGYSTPAIAPHQSHTNITENTLRVGVINFPPFITLSTVGGQVHVRGPLQVFLEALMRLRNSSVAIGFAGDMVHGVRLDNGSFTGIMGLIQRRQIDIFLGPALVIEERLGLVEGMVLDTTTYRLVTWQPSKWVDPFQFVRTFTLDVWGLILFSAFSLAVICWLMERYLTPWKQERKAPLTYFMWEISSRLLSLDYSNRNDGWLRICLSGFLLVFPLVVMNSLNSKLISALTIKRDEDFINKFEDVSRFPDVRVYCEAGSSFSVLFTHPRTETFRKLRPKVILTRGIFSHGPKLVQMMSEVAAKKRVIPCNPEMCQGMIIKVMKKKGRCLKVMTTTESSGFMLGCYLVALALPKPVRGTIRSATFTVLESHLYSKLLGFTTFAAEKCKRRKGISVHSLVPQDVEGSFILLTMGLSSSIVVLIVEKFNRPSRRDRRRTARKFLKLPFTRTYVESTRVYAFRSDAVKTYLK